VDVADDVERTMLVAPVVQQPLSDDRRPGYLLHRAQDVDSAEALLGQAPQRSAQLVTLPVDDMTAEVTLRPVGVAGHADGFGQVENDGHG